MSQYLPEIMGQVGEAFATGVDDATASEAGFIETTATKADTAVRLVTGADGRIAGKLSVIGDTAGQDADGLPAAGGSDGNALPEGSTTDGTGSPSDADRNPEAAGRDPEDIPTTGDPVDVATGDVVLNETDVTLPGSLPLVLQRAHRSGLRTGRWFGRSWASTLDQRLELTAEGVFFAAANGMVLCYPHPGLGEEPVWPVSGARWPLARDGDTYTVTDPQAGTVRRFEPRSGYYLSAEGYGELPLVSVTSRAGHQISVSYGPGGEPRSVIHDGGYEVLVTVSGGQVTGLSLAGAGDRGQDLPLVRYTYDGAGNLAEVINSSGLPLRYFYDRVGRLTGWQDRNDWWYRYHYDAAGRCERGEGPDGMLSATFAYDPDNRVTRCADAAGAVTVYQLTAGCRVAAVTDPLGNTTRSEYDQYGQLVSRTDPLGRVTSWSYDPAGNLTAVTRPDGSRATAAYNRQNLPVLITEPGGATWQQQFDQRGCLTAAAAPDSAVTGCAWDERGNLVAITDPLGAVTLVESSPAGLPVSVTRPDGAVTRFARDSFGRQAEVTAPDGTVTRMTWTTEGQLASRTFGDGFFEQFTYDGEENLVAHLDEVGAVTRYEYTGFDQLAARLDPDGTRTEFSYDLALRLVSVALRQGSGDPGPSLTWRYDYDQAGNMVAETDYDAVTIQYVNDAAGQLTTRVNGAGQTTGYAYDLLGNLTECRLGDVVSRFAYDPMDRIIQASSPDAVLEFRRDAAGRVIAETCNGRTVRSSYDAAGRRIRRVTPSGAETHWAFDAVGRPTALRAGGQELRFGYDLGGRETVRELPGGIRLDQAWDTAGRLTSQVLTAGRVIQSRAYRYQADGYLTSTEDLLYGPRQLSLDRVGQVTSVAGPGWAERYAYDPVGNITAAAWPAAPPRIPGPARSWPGAGVQGGRQYAGTLIAAAGDVRYEHDGQGRVTLRQQAGLSGRPEIWRYEWNADDDLTSVTTPDGTYWRYLYDPLSRRIGKQRLGPDGRVAVRTDFTWDGSVLAEQVSGLAPVAGGAVAAGAPGRLTTWDYEPDSYTPLIQISQGAKNAGEPSQPVAAGQADRQFYAIVTDLIGAPAELVGPDGTLAGYQQRTLWGVTAWHPDGASSPLRFPGQYADPETGLHYNVNRYYDPVTGRYLSPDPLGLEPAPNHHAYVTNPCVMADPLGLANTPKCANEGDFPDWQNEGTDANAGLPGRGSRYTRPDSPYGTVWQDGEYKFEIYSNDHGPAHGHIVGKDGTDIQLGQNGKPIQKNVDLPPKLRKIVDRNAARTRREIDRNMRDHRGRNRGWW
jgi:RHS repeat-associated protein